MKTFHIVNHVFKHVLKESLWISGKASCFEARLVQREPACCFQQLGWESSLLADRENPVAIADAGAVSLTSTPSPPTHSSCVPKYLLMFRHSGFRRRLTHLVPKGGFDWCSQRIPLPLPVIGLGQDRMIPQIWEIGNWGLSWKVTSFFSCKQESEPLLPLAICLHVIPGVAIATAGWESEFDWIS